VAIGDYETAADRDAESRDAEEGKRLLYVALTRARDRLYLSATLNSDGQLAAGKGGLGRTLPVTVAGLFAEAAAGTAGHTSWVGGAGTHRFRVIRPAAAPTSALASAEELEPRADDFAALEPSGPRRSTMPDRQHNSAAGDDDVVWRRSGLTCSMRTSDGTIHRVVMDCIVKRRTGDIDVIRFTSESPPSTDDHAALRVQIDAAVKLFAGSSIRGRLQQLSSGPGV
jgi:hypothetical protein